MKNLIILKWLLLVLGAFIFENNMNAQGCVAVRATGCSGTTNSSTLLKNQLEFSTNFRYLNHIDILLEMSNKKNEKSFIQKLELSLLLMTLGSIMAYPTDFLLISPYLLLSITDLIIIIQTKRV